MVFLDRNGKFPLVHYSCIFPSVFTDFSAVRISFASEEKTIKGNKQSLLKYISVCICALSNLKNFIKIYIVHVLLRLEVSKAKRCVLVI